MDHALKTSSRRRVYKVLVVDDQPSSTELAKIALEDTGHHVVREVNDPRAAAAAARDFAPDLVIMDVDMPRMDGRTVALLIQSEQGLENVPILFVTSMIPESAGQNPFGWWGPLAKPVLPKTLVATVESILGERKFT